MKIIFFGRRQLRGGIAVLVCLVFIAGLIINWDQIARKIFGVKPGVRLEGHLVQGMLPEEVTRLVKALAEKINRDPVNAVYFPETGEIIPAQAGRSVNISGTVRQICNAAPDTHIRVMVDQINPAVSEDLFKPIYRGNSNLPRVALAINVAWGEEHLEEMLQTLRTEKVKATFFLVGTWIKAFPELTRELANAEHELANHGMYHGHPLQMKKDELKKIITENDRLIAAVTGKKGAKFFAPPYGEISPVIVSAAGELGYRTVMWTVDSVDWKLPAPEILLNRVLSKIGPGGIILLHPTAPTKIALRTLIKSLREKGLEPGPVSSVLK